MIQAVRDLHTLLWREPWYVDAFVFDGSIVIHVNGPLTPEERLKAPLAYGGYPVRIEAAIMSEDTPRNTP